MNNLKKLVLRYLSLTTLCLSTLHAAVSPHAKMQTQFCQELDAAELYANTKKQDADGNYIFQQVKGDNKLKLAAGTKNIDDIIWITRVENNSQKAFILFKKNKTKDKSGLSYYREGNKETEVKGNVITLKASRGIKGDFSNSEILKPIITDDGKLVLYTKNNTTYTTHVYESDGFSYKKCATQTLSNELQQKIDDVKLQQKLKAKKDELKTQHPDIFTDSM